MLTNCIALSANRLKTVGPEFKKHTQLLLDMKKDLDYIFKKIRAIKTKLSAQYPEAFAEALRSSLAEECQEDDDFPKPAPDSSETKENAETVDSADQCSSKSETQEVPTEAAPSDN